MNLLCKDELTGLESDVHVSVLIRMNAARDFYRLLHNWKNMRRARKRVDLEARKPGALLVAPQV